MRVLLLGPYPPPHGGVQTNLAAIRRYLRGRGIPCAVINLTRHRRPCGDDVFYPRTGAEVLKLLVRLPYDIAHLHIGGDVSPRLLALSAACCLAPGRKAVLTFHSGGYASSEDGRTARPLSLRGFVFRRFDRIIAVNQEIVDLFRKGFGVVEGRVRLIYPHAPAEPACSLPAPLGDFFRCHSPVLLSVGLLEPEYDLPLQIEALGRMRERFPNAGLAIAGSGSLEGPLRQMVASKPYGAHVLLPGDVPHDVTLRAIADCDLLWRTTLYDGDSISVREALQLGTPVIATNNGMRPEGVELIPASDIAALCAASERRLAEGRGHRQRAQGGEENLQAVYDLYRELTG